MRSIYIALVMTLFTISAFAQGKNNKIDSTRHARKMYTDSVFAERKITKDSMRHAKDSMRHLLKMYIDSLVNGRPLQRDSTTETRNKLSVSTNGVHIDKNKDKEKDFSMEFLVIDLGINTLQDKTDYNSGAAKTFLQVPPSMQNEDLFSLRTGKSVNVNIWPLMGKWCVLHTNKQKIFIGMGVGLQMYNFRFNKNISYVNYVQPAVIEDSISFSKNKLAFSYLSVPLMITFKTKLAEKAWLVYGVGITGGYLINSWTKQISDERGKDKNHDRFNFNDFNSCLTAEIGINGYFRLFGSYQVTALQKNALDQHPISIGIRFGDI